MRPLSLLSGADLPYEDAALFKMLAFEEGVRRTPYNDLTGERVRISPGDITVGIGRNLELNPLSDEEVMFLLRNDLEKSRGEMYQIFSSRLLDSLCIPRRCAILQMLFQMGKRGFLGFPKTIEAIKGRDWKKAGEMARDSLWAREQTPARAERVISMLVTGTFPSEYGL